MKNRWAQMSTMAHTNNPRYLGGWDREDHGWGTAWANSLWNFISKITRAKWTAGVYQVVSCLLFKCEARSSNLSPTKKKKRKRWAHLGKRVGCKHKRVKNQNLERTVVCKGHTKEGEPIKETPKSTGKPRSWPSQMSRKGQRSIIHNSYSMEIAKMPHNWWMN
jgi:hypothetical protein